MPKIIKKNKLLDYMFMKNVPGWFHYSKLIDRSLDLVPEGNILELGCFLGRSTQYIYSKIKNRNYTLTSIDSFGEIQSFSSKGENNSRLEDMVVDSGGMLNQALIESTNCGLEGDLSLIDYQKNFFENFLSINNDLDPEKFRILKGSFKSIYPDLNKESYSLILIDTSHGVKETIRTIRDGLTLLTPGGVICGDDYNWKEVKMAVHFFFEKNNIEVIDCNISSCSDSSSPHQFWLAKGKESSVLR